MPSHIALQCADASLLPCPSGRCWRRRRHRTCVHRRARWRAPPWGTQRRTRHRRITTVSSTSGFHRRRRRRLRGRQTEGRGTTFGAGCAARRAASAPSPPHLHSTRARSAPSIRAAGTGWPDLGVRAQLLRSARASRRAAKGAGRSMANGEMVSSAVLRRAWSRPHRGRRGARARTRREKKGCTHGRIIHKRGPSQYPEEAAALAFFRVPRIYPYGCTSGARIARRLTRRLSDY